MKNGKLSSKERQRKRTRENRFQRVDIKNGDMILSLVYYHWRYLSNAFCFANWKSNFKQKDMEKERKSEKKRVNRKREFLKIEVKETANCSIQARVNELWKASWWRRHLASREKVAEPRISEQGKSCDSLEPSFSVCFSVCLFAETFWSFLRFRFGSREWKEREWEGKGRRRTHREPLKVVRECVLRVE